MILNGVYRDTQDIIDETHCHYNVALYHARKYDCQMWNGRYIIPHDTFVDICENIRQRRVRGARPDDL